VNPAKIGVILLLVGFSAGCKSKGRTFEQTIADALEGKELADTPPCKSTFSFAPPPPGPTKSSRGGTYTWTEQWRCDASAKGRNAAVEKIVEVVHVSSTERPPGPGAVNIRIDLLWKVGGRWHRIPIPDPSGQYPEPHYHGSSAQDVFENIYFEIAEEPRRVAVVEVLSKVKTGLAFYGWIAEIVNGVPKVRKVPDASHAQDLLNDPLLKVRPKVDEE